MLLIYYILIELQLGGIVTARATAVSLVAAVRATVIVTVVVRIVKIVEPDQMLIPSTTDFNFLFRCLMLLFKI